MAPKKRGRKKTTSNSKASSSSMPPKKRKNVFDPNLYENNACSLAKKMLTEIPEWFKLSIQILLINFYPEGVILL
jgi:hypothetical protein